ncbi:hypothetical protein I4U23_027641 [Adineta vaga]|nr:hypothetical protein I4U23_027641 [Adineta vaga]
MEFEKIRRKPSDSCLNRYEILPSIGNSREFIPHPPLIKPSKEINNPRYKKQLKEEKILIAIRFQNGKRIEKEFSSNDRISQIIEFVKNEEKDLSNDIYLSSGDVPKRQFKDFHLTLSQANLQTHTVLFIDRL